MTVWILRDNESGLFGIYKTRELAISSIKLTLSPVGYKEICPNHFVTDDDESFLLTEKTVHEVPDVNFYWS